MENCKLRLSYRQSIKQWLIKKLKNYPVLFKLFIHVKQVAKKIIEKYPDLYQRLVCVDHYLLANRRKRFVVKREANRILTFIQEGDLRNVLIVYDNLISPPTYGDFFYVVMFARYFTSQDIQVNFVIVDGDYRKDWSLLGDVAIKNLVSDHLKMAELLLDPNLATIETLTSSQLQDKIRHASDNGTFVPFREELVSRIDVYSYVMNTLNRLVFKSSQNHLDHFLLSFEELKQKVSFKKPPTPYITWGCRYNTRWGLDRNISEEEFLLGYARLKILYPGHAIMIISDDEGCSHFKRIKVQCGLGCIFSSDYSDSFMGDGALILASAYFFMAHCGGVVVFPWFSRVPYELVITLFHEVPWGADKLFPWASRNQIWRFPTRREQNLPTIGLMHDSDHHPPRLNRI